MAVLPVRLFGDPVLRTPAAEVTAFDADLSTLVDDMFDTMAANGGAGLAAPQVGVSLRVFVWQTGGDSGHIVNPVWTAVGDETVSRREGCLSVPGIYAECERHAEVDLRGVDRRGRRIARRVTGMLARAAQHETDHLDGVMFFARLDDASRRTTMREVRTAHWFGAPAISDGLLVDRSGRPWQPASVPGGLRSGVTTTPVLGATPSFHLPTVARGR